MTRAEFAALQAWRDGPMDTAKWMLFEQRMAEVFYAEYPELRFGYTPPSYRETLQSFEARALQRRREELDAFRKWGPRP